MAGCRRSADVESELYYLLAADALLVLHVLFVLFVVVGLIVILAGRSRLAFVRNPWFRLLHLVCIGVVVAQSWLGQVCPLTVWELALREKAGIATYDGAFIAHWLNEMLYFSAPPWVFAVCYSVFGLLVVVSWIRVRPAPFRDR